MDTRGLWCSILSWALACALALLLVMGCAQEAPEMGAIQMPETGLPPATDLDRYHFQLPEAVRPWAIVPKHFVDEVDPEQPPEAIPEAPRLQTFAARDEWQSLGFVIYATDDLGELSIEVAPLQGPRGR